jgi:hypothetical protein
MKRFEKKHALGIGAALAAIVLAACNPGISALPDGTNLKDSTNALGFVGSTGAIAPTVSVDLLAGQTTLAGSVTVSVEQTDLVVTYATVDGWKLQEAQLSVGIGFSSIPVNKAGNPVVGNFPFKATGLGGIESFAFRIPLSTFDVTAGTTLTIAAHAVVTKTSADGTIRSETGWGAGTRITSKGNWGTFFTVTFGTIPEEPKELTTETAFAYGGSYATSFESFDVSNRWGWTNGPLTAGTYSFPIYAGAGQSDISKGTLVGTLTVAYDGAKATVTYGMKSGFSLTETHLYVGGAQLPSFKGEYTVAPGQYPYKHGALNDVASDSYTVSGLSGSVYVVAHAVVKGAF